MLAGVFGDLFSSRNQHTSHKYELVNMAPNAGMGSEKKIVDDANSDDAVLEQLALITLGRAAGLSLQEIGTMLAVEDGTGIDRTRLAAKADALDLRIARMTVMRDGLRHAAACRAPSHLECPRFRALMRLNRPPYPPAASR